LILEIWVKSIIYLLCYFLSQLTPFVCVWRWSRDKSRESRCVPRWACWCIETEQGKLWGIFHYVLIQAFC